FISTFPEFTGLNSAYITILEINGSHSHKLKSLIETLGIPTLVITDIDATRQRESVPVAVGADQSSSNPALKTWAKFDTKIDSLLKRSQSEKIVKSDAPILEVYFAYQIKVDMKKNPVGETVPVYPSTF